jgi:hypothetical protein
MFLLSLWQPTTCTKYTFAMRYEPEICPRLWQLHLLFPYSGVRLHGVIVHIPSRSCSTSSATGRPHTRPASLALPSKPIVPWRKPHGLGSQQPDAEAWTLGTTERFLSTTGQIVTFKFTRTCWPSWPSILTPTSNLTGFFVVTSTTRVAGALSTHCLKFKASGN